MKYRKISDEVLYPNEEIVRVDAAVIETLKKLADANPRERVRLCAHHSENDLVHEMIIVHKAGIYVRPHKHLGKSESFHVIEGEADVVFFDEGGNIVDVVKMGASCAGRHFYYRLDEPLYHTLVIRSEHFVFHEVTRGPFDRSESVFPSWAPEECDVENCCAFVEQTASRAANFSGIAQ